jgi:hypothetical protein
MLPIDTLVASHVDHAKINPAVVFVFMAAGTVGDMTLTHLINSVDG